jgi:hypothetical protein
MRTVESANPIFADKNRTEEGARCGGAREVFASGACEPRAPSTGGGVPNNWQGGFQMRIAGPDLMLLDREFFDGLIANAEAVERLLADDFLLIDVLSGSEVTKLDLLAVLKSGLLKFKEIKVLDSRVRLYEDTALVTGSTEMSGSFRHDPFSASSRYTHVYVRLRDRWYLVGAQGTQIKITD